MDTTRSHLGHSWSKLRAAICLAVLAACLAGCSGVLEEHREDRVKKGMTIGEVKALLGPPQQATLYYGPPEDELEVSLSDGKVTDIRSRRNRPHRLTEGMSERQVLALMGTPDSVVAVYDFPHTAWARYVFFGDRLTNIVARKATALDVRYDEIALGISRERVRRSFGVTSSIAFDYRTGATPYDWVFFRSGKVPYAHEGSDSARAGVKVGMTPEEVITLRGRPLSTCDLYDAPEGRYGWSFCFDDRDRLVSKSRAVDPVP
jgi:outer membrane protein assembly factor BamE (lipoprotein component of BamABCDE complex)